MPTERIDKRAIPYVEKFLTLCQAYNYNCSDWKKVTIHISPIGKDFIDKLFPTKGSTIGRCNIPYQRITIDTDFFNRSSHADVEATVIHELGHCLFMRKHIDSHIPSIMNAYAMSEWLYKSFYQELMDDFFECKSNCPIVYFNEKRYEEKK